MARLITVATTAFGNAANATGDSNLALGLELIDAAAQSGADEVCLAETFLGSDLSWDACMATAEPLPRPAFEGLAERARRHGVNVVAGRPTHGSGTRSAPAQPAPPAAWAHRTRWSGQAPARGPCAPAPAQTVARPSPLAACSAHE